MKRKMIAMTTAMVMGAVLTACGGSGEGGSGASAGGSGYTFTSGSAKIEMNADASAVVEELGEARDWIKYTAIRDSSLKHTRWMIRIMCFL